MPFVRTETHDGVRVVIADNPPVNALGHAVRAGLLDTLRAAEADAAVQALVIRCDGRTFFAGADITEFGRPPQAPALPEVVDAIEACAKPVVAAIHGTALGGGLEVALGCHRRVAAASVRLGLPEVKLGILPGAGGTQRLPRVVGVEAALPMIVTGGLVGAAQALAMGLIDRMVDDAELVAAALAEARSLAGQTPVCTRDRDDRLEAARVDPGVFDRFLAAHARRMRGLEAPAACVEAVRAAVDLPFDEGLARERELFMRLVSGEQSRALRHAFFAERAAAKIEDAPADTPVLPIGRVGVLGAGTMGGGIAMNFLSAGLPVVMVEREQGALDRGVATIRKNYEATAKRGRLTPEKVEAAMARLQPSLAFEDLEDCDLVIEAVFETMEVKLDVFRRLDAVVKPGAILASNTSYLDIDAIAAATGRPEWVLGLHFFSPANIMKLLEVVRGARTQPDVLTTAMALAKRIGKTAVVARVCHGFIGNRMLARRQEQADALILEGANYADVDRVLTEFGFPMGPFQMADLAGLDLGWSAETSTGATVRDVLCERGRRGQKAGRGFYDYDGERNRTPSLETDAIFADFRARGGAPVHAIGDDEIRERLLYPMVNEGGLILEEGVAQRPGDIDVVWLNGYGWPAWTGGPMSWADTVGRAAIAQALERRRDALGPDFRLSGWLREG